MSVNEKLIAELRRRAALPKDAPDKAFLVGIRHLLQQAARALESHTATPEAPPQKPGLSMVEQGALIETIGAPPLGNVVAGSVSAEPLGDDQTLVRWVGVAIIPRIQFESVIGVVETETRDRDLAADGGNSNE